MTHDRMTTQDQTGTRDRTGTRDHAAQRRGTAFLCHGFECAGTNAQAAAAAIRSHLARPAGEAHR
jgi:hypothetical protein